MVSDIAKKFIQNHYSRPMKQSGPVQGPLQLCECGWGQAVTHPSNRFIQYHWRKPLIQGPLPLCECGCGQVVTKISNKFIKGHWCKDRLYKHKPPNTLIDDINYCRMCKSKNNLTTHHIVPRKYGVNNDEYNLITLCIDCHDKVEILTTSWIDSGREYSTQILKRLIVYIW